MQIPEVETQHRRNTVPWVLLGGATGVLSLKKMQHRSLSGAASCLSAAGMQNRVSQHSNAGGLASMGRQARMALAGRMKEASSPQVPWMPCWLTA